MLQSRKNLPIKLITLKTIGIFTIFLNSIAIAQPSLNNNKICPDNLAQGIETIINTSNQQRAFWGILVKTLNSERILYQLNADKYFIPASNVKLLTTAAALLKFGADYQINTPVYIRGNPPHLKSLRIVGKGDPTLTNEHLKELAQKLKTMGVRQIDQLILEDGYLAPPQLNPTWEWSDLYYYYAVPVNSLILNENAVSLSLFPQEIGHILDIKWSDPLAAKQWLIDNKTLSAKANTDYNISLNLLFQKPLLEFQGELAVDSEADVWWLSILNPGEYFLDSLRHILIRKGIIITNSNLISKVNLNFEQQEQERNLLTFQSPSLEKLVQTVNQNSNNLFAEVLFKYIINDENHQNNLTELELILTELGLEKNSYKLADGSGLSRHNLVTPKAFTDILKLMATTKYNKIYRQSLAVAGVNGTLKKRFQNTLIESNLQGKTGTLTGVSALSGYLEIPDYQPLVLSIIVNNSPEKSSSLSQVIDEIVILLSQLNEC
jgi:D-alanyl-D-alanine carboxypeptidase/D-alanyl-D-alanine-endopeptidase (penicillin-binding protein 4)